MRVKLPFHYGWVVVALGFLASLIAAGVRAAPAVLIHPLEAEFGWSRAGIASAASISLLLFGVGAPFSGYLVDRIGPRRVKLACLGLLVAGVAGTLFMRQLWHFIILWGIVVGLGASSGPVISPSIANRWFSARRGLALGILTNANATGQVIFLPVLMALIVTFGWRVGSMFLAAVALVMIPLIALWMRDDPSEVGLEPYGSKGRQTPAGGESSAPPHGLPPGASVPLKVAVKTRTFWLLAGCFFVCGVTANGLIGTHLIPHAIERGIPEIVAATAVGIMGGASFFGTLLSGWLSDRLDPRKVLAAVYTLRGSSLFLLPFLTDYSGLFIFAVIYGLDWFASGPATAAIAADTFGRGSVGRIYGWIFLSHQIGASLAAVGGGAIYMWRGDYEWSFVIGGILGLAAGAMALRIPSGREGPGSPLAAAALSS